jgi:hypothetical protein
LQVALNSNIWSIQSNIQNGLRLLISVNGLLNFPPTFQISYPEVNPKPDGFKKNRVLVVQVVYTILAVVGGYDRALERARDCTMQDRLLGAHRCALLAGEGAKQRMGIKALC